MNLLVIGPGHLGARVATLWQARYPEAKIALKAHRDDSDREAKWQSLGFIPYKDPNQRYSNVLFAAPPSGTGGEQLFLEIYHRVSRDLSTKKHKMILKQSIYQILSWKGYTWK